MPGTQVLLFTRPFASAQVVTVTWRKPHPSLVSCSLPAIIRSDIAQHVQCASPHLPPCPQLRRRFGSLLFCHNVRSLHWPLFSAGVPCSRVAFILFLSVVCVCARASGSAASLLRSSGTPWDSCWCLISPASRASSMSETGWVRF